MNRKIKAIIAIAAATLFGFCPVAAHADRIYFLVGVRHVYEIGPDRDLHLSERVEIEKNYADGVAEDQDTFNQHVASGADREKESESLNQDLDALADARDKSLGSLFAQRDELRERHPELQIQGDGPYQVMGIEMHESGDTEVFDRFAVYAPWPDYVVVGGCYGGWDYGVWYEPGIFFDLYWGWWGSFGGFRFCPGFYGHHGRVDFRPHGFVDHSRFAGGGNRFGRSAAAGTRSWGSGRGSASGYTHSYAGGSRSGGYGRSGSWNRYSHSNSSTGFSRSTAGGYSHASSGGYSRGPSSGNSNRSTGYSRYSHGSSSGWGGYSRSSEGRGYSHESGSSSSYGARSGGFGRSSSSGGQDRGGSAGWGGSHSGGSRSSGGGGSSSGGGRSGSGSGGGRSGGSSGGHSRGR